MKGEEGRERKNGRKRKRQGVNRECPFGDEEREEEGIKVCAMA